MGLDLTFRQAFFLLERASLHWSLNQIVLLFRTEGLLLGIVYIAMSTSFLLKSSTVVSELSIPRCLLAHSAKWSQFALQSFQIGVAYEVLYNVLYDKS